MVRGIVDHERDSINTNTAVCSPYEPNIVTTTDYTYDYAFNSPHLRQAKIDSYLRFDDIVSKYEEEGSVKVLRGNPRKFWQVLDESFPVEARIAAQTAVRDEQTVQLTLPEKSGGMGQIRRRDLISEVDFDTTAQLSLPLKTSYIN